MTDVTFSICAYNDQDSIKLLVNDSIRIAEELSLDYNILIIDDGSSDNTNEIINSLASHNPDIQIHKHEKNLGFGPTIGEVYQLPETEWLLFLPGDNQLPAHNLKKMTSYTKDHNFILGHRVIRQDSLFRKLNSMIYNFCISKLARQKIKDVNSSALVKSSVVKDLKLNSKSGFIHAEVLLKSLKSNCTFIEIPIDHNDRGFGEASGGKFKTISFTIFEMIKYIFGK